MNKKGFSITGFLNAALISGVIYFIVFMITGSGGGFRALANVGKILAGITDVLVKMPAWAWIGAAGFILLLLWSKK